MIKLTDDMRKMIDPALATFDLARLGKAHY